MPTSQNIPTKSTSEENFKALGDVWEKEVASQKLPALAIGVVKEGKLVWHRGFGETQAGKPVSPEAVFRIGSVTKVFTALALLKLRDEGKLNLSDPVAQYLPELTEVLSPPGQPPVTLLHLITHSSGVPTLGDGTLDWTTGEPIAEEVLLKSVKNATLEFPPGSRFAYSNVGVALAGLIVARVSGISYREYIDSQFLKPLGMKHTFWEPEPIPEDLLVPGHWREGDSFRRADLSWRLGVIEPAGGLYSNLEDMARFLAWQMGKGTPEAEKILARSTTEEAQKPSLGDKHPTGLGWMAGQETGLGPFVWHNGSTLDYSAWVGLLPEREIGLIILCATGDLVTLGRFDSLAMESASLLIGKSPVASQEKPPAEPTPKALVDSVLDKVKALLENPERDYTEFFAPSFLKSQPEAELKKFFTQVSESTGACSSFEMLNDEGKGVFEVKLTCVNAKLHIKLAAEEAPPHLIEGILIRPAL